MLVKRLCSMRPDSKALLDEALVDVGEALVCGVIHSSKIIAI